MPNLIIPASEIMNNNVIEPAQQQPVISHNIIIIHPGSQNLRIGRASDPYPVTLHHAIARKRLRPDLIQVDTLLPAIYNDQNILAELDEARLQVSHILQSCLQSDGSRRYATPPQQISAFNRRSRLEVVRNTKEEPFSHENVIIGDDVLNLPENEEYNVFYPIRRGVFNIHAGVGGSLTSVLHDLETIWLHAIEKRLKIPRKHFPVYKVVLVIPDIFNRKHLSALMNLVLTRMNFNSCFLVQDHIAATFGAGFTSACVVDVGDQKTSISCVDDGISQPSTRIRLDYGGGDITVVFYRLLQKCSFPYKQCNLLKTKDAVLLQKLKEDFCHVDLDICGPREKSFEITSSEGCVQRVTLQVGDECLIAPLSLFTTDLLSITGTKGVHGQVSYEFQSEDPHDANYLRETSRKAAKENLDVTGDGPGNMSCLGNIPLPLDINSVMEEDIVEKEIFESEILLSIDQAIMQSIERCSEELRKKMYSCVLIVGGGMKFVGINTWLQNKISLQIPYMYRSEQMDVLTFLKETDPQITTWKGASLMATLESASELWIKSQDWLDNGAKTLREKAAFVW
ncbi:actin-related protein 8 isoform X2 [Neocloeon triangulifer]|uniref:actin-related protein 8 isoform X2 n=1 Tax=Neocloeon triangulifer TaxID=2078957 RepID=UPI00286ED138|nr:actin-related protein 8 isoform X2 [Neocloeon triangulifer]